MLGKFISFFSVGHVVIFHSKTLLSERCSIVPTE